LLNAPCLETTVIVSGICWSAAFLLYAVAYAPYLARARLDGKPGQPLKRGDFATATGFREG
jgi:uncharacterized protein involved in response to NO